MGRNINYFSNRKEKQKDKLIQGIKDIEKFFMQEFNIKLYLVYGTLLGCIREKNFIFYDHDVDTAYLSLKNNKNEVLKETQYIYKVLKKNNMLGKAWTKEKGAILSKDLKCSEHMIGHAHVWNKKRTACIDVFTSWIENDKYYLVRKINGEFNKNILEPFLLRKLRGKLFRTPNGSIRLLKYWYNNWEEKLEKNYSNCKKVCKL